MTRWSQADIERAGLRIQNEIATPLKPKYGNEKCQFQGMQFDSKRELKAYQDLKLREAAGLIRAVISQVSLRLPGTKRRIRVDFMVVCNDGRIRWYDAKGFETAHWKAKRQQVKEAYGLEIELV